MSGPEIVRIDDGLPDPAPRRVARAGVRIAGLGLTTVQAVGRVRGLPDASLREGARERALVLRDAARRVLHLHGIVVEATGALPIGPVILVANHVSWLDPLVIASLVPCAPVSKLEVARWPVIGSIARELGVVFVSRGDPASGARALNAAADALAHGVSVLNFPEGTTTAGGGVLPFRAGIFGLALRTAVPVVPVGLAYDPPSLAWVGDATFLPHYLTLATRRRARATVRLGTPVVPTGGMRAAGLARAIHADVERLLEAA
jgi:1-acyl-sn-glycerol-3-phosphate acyltransferase